MTLTMNHSRSYKSRSRKKYLKGKTSLQATMSLTSVGCTPCTCLRWRSKSRLIRQENKQQQLSAGLPIPGRSIIFRARRNEKVKPHLKHLHVYRPVINIIYSCRYETPDNINCISLHEMSTNFYINLLGVSRTKAFFRQKLTISTSRLL